MNSKDINIINPGLPTESKYGYSVDQEGLKLYKGKYSELILSKSLILDIIKEYKSDIKAILEEDSIHITNRCSYKILGEECFTLEEACNIYSRRISDFLYINNITDKKLYDYIPYIINYNKQLDHVEVNKFPKFIEKIFEEKIIINNLKDFALFLQQEEFKKLY